LHKSIYILIFGIILQPLHAFALGLGDIQVNSRLNQQLEARIDVLSAAPEDAEVLIVKLASHEEFTRAGLDRPYGLTDLRFRALVDDGRVYITVASPKPIREPSLSFLLEVDWPQGHLIRQYTILLEPPISMGQTGTQKAASTSNRPAMSE